MQKQIVTTFTMPGFHAYEGAPDEVIFLSSTHRHLFKFKVFCHVVDSNRELEFFIVQRRVKKFIMDMWANEFGELRFGNMSCEMIAERILVMFKDIFNMVRVEVWEDDESGGIVEL